ncbi:MAG TPA: HlyD family efflux transporter periplasmic adaptor subunit, partial [Telluria sp.]|nr:HlyD family efflux transporter periplasmic adaptor subunit [Telluria sp.]
VVRFLGENQLLRADPHESPAQMARRARRERGSFGTWLLHHYLFFRVPLFKPDRWLGALAPRCAPLLSPAFRNLSLLALAAGALGVYRDWTRFSASVADSLTASGLLSYLLALGAVKCAHELGHALTAKRYGCRVPAMGLAFLVLWPVPYTDTSDAWRLRSHAARLRIAAAGVATELTVAAWATLAWVLLPDGMLRQAAFALATTTWVATVAVNSSPFMRFDGYFVLCDWLRMPNLHARAFALARWQLREWIFGAGLEPPEYHPRATRALLIGFAWLTWAYRLALYLGIALLVYHFFIKLVGIFLFAVELGWFILRPLAGELAVWRALWPRLPSRRRAPRVAAIAAGLLLLLCVPLPTRIQAGAMAHAAQSVPVFAPVHAQVAVMPFGEGARVKEGEVLVRLLSATGDARLAAAHARVERLRWQAGTAGFDPEQRRVSGSLEEELATAAAELAAAEQESARLAPRAPFGGTLRDLDPDLAPGTWVHRNEKLALLVGDGPVEVDGYLDEATVHRIAVGDRAHFYPDGDGPVLTLTVSAIDRDATRVLPSGMLAAERGGLIAARERQGSWIPEHAVYHVSFRAEGAAGAHLSAVRGKVVVAGAWEAPARDFFNAFFSVLWREAGF